MGTVIKLKINRAIFDVLHSFVAYCIPHIKVTDIGSLCGIEALEELLRKFDQLKYTQRKSYTFNLNLVTAKSLCEIFYAMQAVGIYENVIARELIEYINKQIDRHVRNRTKINH